MLAVLTVDSLADNLDDDGLITLREAILAANTDTVADATEGIQAGDGADTIVFDSSLDGGNILLTQGLLPQITDNLDINAASLLSGLTVDASGNDSTPGVFDALGTHVFVIGDGSPGNLDVELRGLTITGADTSSIGAIVSRENLTLVDSIVTGNGAFSGGGVHAVVTEGGSLSIIGSVIANNHSNTTGGGLYASILGADSSVSISDTVFTSNSANGAGGGVYIENLGETVSISDSEFSLNTSSTKGGGLYVTNVDGASTITRSTFGSNESIGNDGGGAYLTSRGSSATTTVTSSTFSGNAAERTGAGLHIRSDGGATSLVENSTISGNTSTGPSLNDSRFGGGLALQLLDDQGPGATLEVVNSTISGNTSIGSGGGVYVYAEAGLVPAIRHSTIAFNQADADNLNSHTGGGIFATGTGTSLLLDHTLVAKNTTYTTANDLSASGGGFVFVGEDGFVETVAGATVSGVIGGLDPLLGPLAGNGGPTKTHALMEGSPAINAGDLTFSPPPTSDQRGLPFSRVADDGSGVVRIDIGAYEVQSIPSLSLVVDTILDESDGDYSPGDLSLREAAELANGSIGGDTISFDPTLFANPQEILLELGEIELVDTVSIDATTVIGSVTIDAQQRSRIFNFTNFGGNFSVAGLTLTGGSTTADGFEQSGGAIRSNADSLVVSQSTISGNSTAGDFARGGGIHSSRQVELLNSTVSGNTTAGLFARGGGVFSDSRVTVHSSVVSGNSTSGDNAGGGGISGSSAVVSAGSVIVGNHTSGDGADAGGLWVRSGAEISGGSSLESNYTLGLNSRGGAIYSFQGETSLDASVVTGNSTVGNISSGGGIYSDRGNVTLTNNSLATLNSTSGVQSSGGAIRSRAGDVNLIDSIVSGNFTSNTSARGGGIGAGEVNVTRSTVSANHTLGYASVGGGVYAFRATIEESVIGGNYTTGKYSDGGGVRAVFVTITNSRVQTNRTEGELADGGGVFANESLNIENSTIRANSTNAFASYGGGVNAQGQLTITNSTISGNSAGPNSLGGGVFAAADATINHSTFTSNYAFAGGGGIAAGRLILLTSKNSIFSGNSAGGGSPDIRAGSPAQPADLAFDYSLVEQTGLSLFGAGNVVGVSADLGPYADTGGQTFAHALLPGSPAIDSGDPTVAFDLHEFDQRGEGFFRVGDGGGGVLRIDMGAIEVQTAPPVLPGDYNGNGQVEIADYTVWRDRLGTSVPPYSAGDGDGDAQVTRDDYTLWVLNFGMTAPAPVSQPALAAAFAPTNAPAGKMTVDEAGNVSTRDAAFALLPVADLVKDRSDELEPRASVPDTGANRTELLLLLVDGPAVAPSEEGSLYEAHDEALAEPEPVELDEPLTSDLSRLS